MKRNDYIAEAKEKWGNTPEYRDFEGREDIRQTQLIAASEITAIFKEFSDCCHLPADSLPAQSLVRKLRDFITGHFYRCSDETLKALSALYVTDERFKEYIDRTGEGTAAFVHDAVEVFCRSKSTNQPQIPS